MERLLCVKHRTPPSPVPFYVLENIRTTENMSQSIKKVSQATGKEANTYSNDEKKIGEWVRDLSAKSQRGWKALYHTGEWKHKRDEILRRDHFACQICKAKGRYTRADTVHHVKHLRDVPELALTNENLMSLCSACHEEIHKTENRTERGFYSNQERW